MDSGRLEAFSDGVMAVAITLLVLNLSVLGPGHGTSLGHQLVEKRWSFAAFFVSFFTIGVVWVNHHNLFKNVREVDRVMLFMNLVLLLFVVLIPFVTSTLALYLRSPIDSARTAAILYTVVLEGMGISFGVIFARAAMHGNLNVPLSPSQARRASLRFGIGAIAYLVAIAVAFVSAPGALAISAGITAFYIFEQAPAVANESS
jgi:uncharacterized membrane protein